MKTRISLLSVALAVCSAAPLAAQTLTTWDYPVKVTASDGALTKSSGCDGCADSGAHSAAQLTADGYSEFVAPAPTRLFAGLGSDLSAATSSSTINYAFSLWPSGAWEIRELGVYKTEGTYAAGDRFRVAVENGAVVYRRNGTVVYTSKTAPSFPLALDVTLYALGAALSQASVATTTITSTTTTPGTPTAVGPYQAVTDRNIYPKPALPVLGPAGSLTTDPVFKTPIRRITDSLTRPGAAGRSYRTPSSPHQNSWSVNSSYFYVMGSGGIGPIPYAFDAATGTARRLQPSTSGDGGLVLKFYIEPQFSYVDDTIIYGSYSGSGATLHTVDQYDFSTGAYTRLLDLETIVAGLSGTYIGGVASSGGANERLEAFFGGTSQDHHRYVVVFDRANPQNRHVVDTIASTIDGRPSPVTLNFSLHHVMIDRSGRYVMLYTTSADQGSPRYAAQSYLWDVETGGVSELATSALPYGHDAFGYGIYVNKDCCTSSSWDAGQWQFRSLASPLAPHDLIKTILTPKETYLSDHTTWNNARPDRAMPVVSGLYRFGANTTAWRPWDDEIIAIQTDAAAGTESTVWRFAHHRSNVANDTDATRVAFWYQPHPNVSQDGKWILFTSNWEKTLGTDVAGEVGTGARQDVFLLALSPAQQPVAIATASLPSGRATLAYSAPLVATGGSGAFTWSATSLPAGLTIDTVTGTIAGTPSAWGANDVLVTVADATNAANAASGTFALTIAAPPVTIAGATLPSVRATLPYSATLQAAGGSGSYSWSIVSGSLPAGVVLDAATGALSGVATTAGSSNFTVRAADVAEPSNSADGDFTIDIGAPPVQVAAATLPGSRAKVAYAAVLTASGGSGGYLWSLSNGALPAGVALDASGTLAGTPSAAGTFVFTATATDGADGTNSASAAFTITIAPPAVTIASAALASGRERVAYSAALQSAGGSGSAIWSATGLPGGLSLNTSTGAIAGTPTLAGDYTVTATATDAADATNTATATFTVTIAAGVKIVSPRSLPDAKARWAYTYTVLAANVIGTPTWNLQGGSLPPGMSLDPATGAISGICTTRGTYSFNARVKDVNTSDTLTLTIRVK